MTKYIGSNAPYGVFEKQLLPTNGILQEFVLLYQVPHASSILVVSDGVIQEPNYSYSLSEGGRKITFSYAPLVTERVYVVYLGKELALPKVVGNFPFRIRLDSIWNNVITDVNLSPYLPPSVSVLREEGTLVFLNGAEQRFGLQWTFDILPDLKSGSVIKFLAAPLTGSVVDIYVTAAERSDISSVTPGSLTGDKLVPGITIGSNVSKAEAIYVKNLYADTTLTNYVTSTIELKTHLGYPNTERFTETFAGQTNSASPTIIHSKPIIPDSTTTFEVTLVGRNITTDENVWVKLTGGLKRIGGVLSFLGTVQNQSGTDSSDYSAYVDVSGTTLQIKAIGHPTDLVNWTGTITYQSLTDLII